MTLQKVNNHTTMDLMYIKGDDTLVSELKRRVIRMIKKVKEDMQKQVNKIQDNLNKHLKKPQKQLNELKEDTNI
jgi:ribosome recycling factor